MHQQDHLRTFKWRVPSGPPSRGGDVPVCVFWHKPTELAHTFLTALGVYFCLYDPFNCISFHKFSRQLSSFSSCSSGLISAVIVLSTVFFFLKVSINFSFQIGFFCVAPVKQLGEVSWSVMCAACCHIALVLPVRHLSNILTFSMLLSFPFLKKYFLKICYW